MPYCPANFDKQLYYLIKYKEKAKNNGLTPIEILHHYMYLKVEPLIWFDFFIK